VDGVNGALIRQANVTRWLLKY